MSEDKDNGLIRFLVVAFPTGLILIGGLAVAVTHVFGDRAARDPNENVRLQAASLNRRPVNADDLRAYLTTLSEIGERHAASPEALSTASYWLASTLGGANTGYLVEAHSYEWEGAELRNLVAELPGRTRRSEIVVFGAAYDAAPALESESSGQGEEAAVLLAVARSLAGDSQGRSVRFVAYATGNVLEAAGSAAEVAIGREQYAQRARGRGDGVVAVLSLVDGPAPEGSAAVRFRGNEAARFLADRAAGAFRLGSGLEVEVSVPEAPEASVPPERDAQAQATELEPGEEWGGRVAVIEVAGWRLPKGLDGGTVTIGGHSYDLDRLEAFAKGMEAAARAMASP